ncbi:hypothetical protein B0H13DRAFT_2329608 [Mycena leptocephala]|nr:hypothetical protein B0H13DRAFT_2329608 [Mycena leptocephala]
MALPPAVLARECSGDARPVVASTLDILQQSSPQSLVTTLPIPVAQKRPNQRTTSLRGAVILVTVVLCVTFAQHCFHVGVFRLFSPCAPVSMPVHLHLAQHGRIRVLCYPNPAHDWIWAHFCSYPVRIRARRLPDRAMSILWHGGGCAPP